MSPHLKMYEDDGNKVNCSGIVKDIIVVVIIIIILLIIIMKLT